MNEYLKILADNFNPFYDEGFVVTSPSGSSMTVRGVLHNDITDLPAGAAAKRLVGHVGYYGCLECEIKGFFFF